MSPEKSSVIAWSVLATEVALYDIFCLPGATLSEGVDHALERPYGKILALGGIAITAAHLANILPSRLDPFARLLRFKDRVGEAVDDAMDCWSEE